jgi:hypothetical protein
MGRHRLRPRTGQRAVEPPEDAEWCVDSTIAGKILARKRPELIPIVDSVVAGRLACMAGAYWTTFRRVLQIPALRVSIAALKPDQPVLRILDTVMWMRWRRGGLTSEPSPA